MKISVEIKEPENKTFKSFLKASKWKVISAVICLLFGGVSTAASAAGVISTLLYLIGLGLALSLVMDYREFKKT